MSNFIPTFLPEEPKRFVVSSIDAEFQKRLRNEEHEKRVKTILLKRCETVEQVQPGYWSEIAQRGSVSRIVKVII
jgi:hypothetical protein